MVLQNNSIQLIKQASIDNAKLEEITLNFCIKGNITDSRTKNDLILLARLHNISLETVTQAEPKKLPNTLISQNLYLVNALNGGTIHPADKKTISIHEYIVKNLYKN